MKTDIHPDDYDLIDYINQLREGICEAYTGIIQGLRGDKKGMRLFSCNLRLQWINWLPVARPLCALLVTLPKTKIEQKLSLVALSEFLGRMVEFLELTFSDLALSFRGLVRNSFANQHIQQLIDDCAESDTPETKDTANWVRQVMQG